MYACSCFRNRSGVYGDSKAWNRRKEKPVNKYPVKKISGNVAQSDSLKSWVKPYIRNKDRSGIRLQYVRWFSVSMGIFYILLSFYKRYVLLFEFLTIKSTFPLKTHFPMIFRLVLPGERALVRGPPFE